jgi:Fe-S-cluster-containing hydrogenase component 2
MSKILFISPSKCVACGQCEIVCALFKKAYYDPNASCIRVEISVEESLSYPILCIQCEDPKCQQSCPSGAILRNEETGAVVVDEDRCIGCKMCILACPFGCIRFQEKERKVLKCDLCSGDPECIHFCPTQALEFCESEEISFLKLGKIFDKVAGLLRKSD